MDSVCSSKYCAAKEWWAYTGMPTRAPATTNESSKRFTESPPEKWCGQSLAQEPQRHKDLAANYANDAKWAHQRILDAPIWRHSRNSRLSLCVFPSCLALFSPAPW